jgi:hypothetical protein
MRKLLSIVLLAVMFFTGSGYYLYFRILQNHIKKEIKKRILSGIADDGFELLILNADELASLKWIEKNKEFEYKGQMYDVVGFELKNGKYFYNCINDRKEKALINSYLRTNRRRRNLQKKIKRILTSEYLPGASGCGNIFPDVKQKFKPYLINYIPVFKDAALPPPKSPFFIV